MNKAKKALLVSTIVATSLFAKVSDAVASTLQANDKQDFQTEQITEITDNTTNSISMNLDNTTQDTSEVKKLFLTPWFLDANELKEFDTLWNNATKSPIRPYYEEAILDIFSDNVENIEKVVLILAILDPIQQTTLGKRAIEKINKSEYYQIRIKQTISIMKKKQNIAELDKRNAELDKEIKETQERIKETEERIKELKDFIQELETFEKLFEKVK